MPIFYPSVAVNMTLRFDEALLSGGNTPDGKTPTDGADTQLGGPSGPIKKAGLLDGTSSRLTFVIALVPKAATIELPTFRQTPKFNLTFAFKDFPLDPRAIRSMAVEVYIGTVQGDDWASGMRGGLQDNGRLTSQIQLKPENLMLAGLVDSLVVTHGERGSEVQIEGKGLQGLFLAAKINAQVLKHLNLDQPLNDVIAQLLPMDAQGKKIPIRYSPDEFPFGVPKPAAQELLSRINKGTSGKETNKPIKSDPNTVAVWDVITDLCFLVGVVPYFVGHALWIRPARSIYDAKNAGAGDTPFKDGQKRSIKTGNTSVDVAFRKMVYGRNLQTLKLERKFGPTTVPTFRCVSVDNTKKGKDRLLEVEWPEASETKARRTSVDPSGAASRTEVLTVPIPGIVDKTRLRDIARQLYEEQGRGEMGGSASSKDLSSLGGDNNDADLITLRPGDPIEFLVDAAGLQSIPPVVSELTNQAAMSTDQAIKSIADKLGGRRDLAEVLVGTSRGKFNGLQNTFRVNNVKYAWDVSSGLAVDFDFQNYIQVRYDVGAKSLADPTASPSLPFISSGGT